MLCTLAFKMIANDISNSETEVVSEWGSRFPWLSRKSKLIKWDMPFCGQLIKDMFAKIWGLGIIITHTIFSCKKDVI